VGLNSVVNWDTHSGYFIKVTNDCSIELRGCNETDQVLSLPEGWSLIPVLSHDPVLVEDLFAGLDSLEVVKSIGCGNGIYWPRFGTNQLVYLHPGCGYYLRMNDPGSINFSAASDQSNPVKPADILYPSSPWNEVTGTPGSHLVVFNLADAVLEQGDIIGGFNQYGCCAGIVEVTCPDRPIAVALNGDDPYTMEIDGFVMDELLNYRIYRASSGEIFDMEVTYNPYMNTGYFEHHGMSEVMGVKMSASVVSNGASGDLRIYPNPTHGIFSIKGFDGSVNVQILNAFGVEIYVGEIYLPEKLDLTGRPKGVYIIRIDYRDEVYFRKLAIE
nr:T9SS type A sorting domain-containing protein [Bacteroidota bacterium]